MKNKKTIAAILLILIFVISGCKSENNKKEHVNQNNGKAEKKITDQQISFAGNRMCESEDGFYYGSSMRVMYYDKALGINTILCFNSTCNHQGNECTGVFNNFLTETIVYNGGSIYITGYEKKSGDVYDVYLYRVSLDGGVREKLFRVAVYETEMLQDPMIIHRGYYYFTEGSGDEDGNVRICRRKLEKNSEIETVYEADKGCFAAISNLVCYEQNLYFEYEYCLDEKEDKYDFYLMKTDVCSLKTEVAAKDFTINWYYICGNDKILAYTIDGSIKEYKPDINEVKTILKLEKDKFYDFSSDGDYIYFKESGRIEVYGMDGEKLQDVETDMEDVPGDFLYGNKEYLFCLCVTDDLEFILYKGNKKLLETGEFKWEKCENGV